MKLIYLTDYSVRGIKTLEQLVSLSFYKKSISRHPDTQQYNVKGIYGMNGSGKSGIVASVDILKNLLINSGYLNNPIVQRYLEAIINKKSQELFIEADYMVDLGSVLRLFRYSITLSKEHTGKYIISHEKLSSKNATSKSENMETVYEVKNGEIISVIGEKKDELTNTFLDRTVNLLSTASMNALFREKNNVSTIDQKKVIRNTLFVDLIVLTALGIRLHAYLDQSDDHRNYFIQNSLRHLDEGSGRDSKVNLLMRCALEMDSDILNIISIEGNIVPQKAYNNYKETVDKLYEFLHIFKSDLQRIDIDRKEDHDMWDCSLIMVYDSYKIHAEFESTGIKKLIRLFAYLNEMVHGGIVFIDEFDSNLHDVYLCALMEYLMEYGDGQLCFTTHNVGPMDVLKQHKKSIDFLSADHQIHSWKTNGNYSPSKLYRNGMIEGSPFNVDSIDFIGVFGSGEEDE